MRKKVTRIPAADLDGKIARATCDFEVFLARCRAYGYSGQCLMNDRADILTLEEAIEKGWHKYSRAWHGAHGPAITVTLRTVVVYTKVKDKPEYIMKRYSLDSWRGMWWKGVVFKITSAPRSPITDPQPKPSSPVYAWKWVYADDTRDGYTAGEYYSLHPGVHYPCTYRVGIETCSKIYPHIDSFCQAGGIFCFRSAESAMDWLPQYLNDLGPRCSKIDLSKLRLICGVVWGENNSSSSGYLKKFVYEYWLTISEHGWAPEVYTVDIMCIMWMSIREA